MDPSSAVVNAVVPFIQPAEVHRAEEHIPAFTGLAHRFGHSEVRNHGMPTRDQHVVGVSRASFARSDSPSMYRMM